MHFEEVKTDCAIWRNIPGYEGVYQVSNDGQVKSLKRIVDYGHLKVTRNERLLKIITDKDGYKIVGLNKDAKQRLFKVHRLVAMAFIPNPEALPLVNHINGVKDDNRPENLEWATNAQNIQHAYDNGLAKAVSGEKCGASKFSENDIKTMRELAEKGMMHKDIAKKFGVRKRGIHNIITRKSWKQV